MPTHTAADRTAFGSGLRDWRLFRRTAGSACYEAVTYLAEQGITSGTGGNCYSPEDLITVRQWAVMLCRAYLPDTLPTESYESLGDACVRQCYREGWVTESLC